MMKRLRFSMSDEKPKLRVLEVSAPPSSALIEKKWAEFTRALKDQRRQTSGDPGELIPDQVEPRETSPK